MNPPQKKQILIHAVVEHDLFIFCLTRIRRALLIGDQETPDKQRIVDRRTAQHATHLKPPTCVISSDFEEFLPEVFREEERSYRVAILKICAWFKGETFFLGNCWWASVSSRAERFFARDFRPVTGDSLR
jgi:hypothetical protein